MLSKTSCKSGVFLAFVQCVVLLQYTSRNSPSFVADYKRDPYTRGHPCKTICCRDDLKLRRARPGGCYDTKVRGYCYPTEIRVMMSLVT